MADRIVVMREGTAQQIGSPEEVYAQPANLHVARFMGFRNLLDLEIDQINAHRALLHGPGITLMGSIKQTPAGKRAVAAIRPDELSIASASSPNAIAGRVEGVEYYGRDSLVDVVVEGGARPGWCSPI
jgi:putative spermidine/putrescine transport system ATP-binding protein